MSMYKGYKISGHTEEEDDCRWTVWHVTTPDNIRVRVPVSHYTNIKTIEIWIDAGCPAAPPRGQWQREDLLKLIEEQTMTQQNEPVLTNAQKNAVFDSLTPEQRRMVIAKEVLNLLDAKLIKPKAEIWLTFPEGKDVTKDQYDADGQVQDFLCQLDEPCEVCHVGALMLATIRLFNDLTFKQAMPYRRGGLQFQDLHGYMGRYFPLEQLQLMEFTFENGRGLYRRSDEEPFGIGYYNGLKLLTEEQVARCEAFNKPFVDGDWEPDDEDDQEDDDRTKNAPISNKTGLMRAICTNILDNGGAFVP